jgi:hypothetical protein
MLNCHNILEGTMCLWINYTIYCTYAKWYCWLPACLPLYTCSLVRLNQIFSLVYLRLVPVFKYQLKRSKVCELLLGS